MALEKTIQCTVYTSEVTVFEGDVEMGVLPAIDGEWMVMYNHAPSVVLLGQGGLRLKTDKWQHFFIDSGVAQIKNNNISILCNHAQDAQKMSIENLQKELKTLEADNKGPLAPEVLHTKLKLDVAKLAQNIAIEPQAEAH